MEAWQTFGHLNVKNILDLQLKSGQFSHAYLLAGPQGIGKKMLALELAEKILNTQNLATHPDFAILDQAEEIRVERMQQFMEGLSFKPFMGAKKVAVINNAHLMNIQSSNALLKTLEEPSVSTVVILVSANKNLLPTIVSRCQTFYLNSFSKEQLKTFAEKQGLKINNDLLILSFGSVGKLLELRDGKNLSEAQKTIKEFKNLRAAPEADRLLAIAEFAELETLALREKFLSWLFWQKQELSENIGMGNSMGRLLNSLDQLNTNKNKKLILQELFLNIC